MMKIIHNPKDNTYRSVYTTPIKDKDGKIRRILEHVIDVTEREKALETNRIILDDLHHRVKNNLQLIQSMISIERHENMDPDDILKATENRIDALANVHRMLYSNDDITSINVKDYTQGLIQAIQSSGKHNANITSSIADEMLSFGQSRNYALLLNEIITNSIKYGDNDGDVTIDIELKRNKSLYELTVKDHGVGFPQDIKKGAGLLIIEGLTEQMKGSIEYENSPEGGALVKVYFP